MRIGTVSPFLQPQQREPGWARPNPVHVPGDPSHVPMSSCESPEPLVMSPHPPCASLLSLQCPQSPVPAPAAPPGHWDVGAGASPVLWGWDPHARGRNPVLGGLVSTAHGDRWGQAPPPRGGELQGGEGSQTLPWGLGTPVPAQHSVPARAAPQPGDVTLRVASRDEPTSSCTFSTQHPSSLMRSLEQHKWGGSQPRRPTKPLPPHVPSRS